jgi:hypothetical protein
MPILANLPKLKTLVMKQIPSRSVQGFLHNTIDYAGLFPPASLNLEESLDNFAGYLIGPQSWMLSKFVCPFRKTKELSLLPGFKSSRNKIRLSLLSTSSLKTDEFIQFFTDDMLSFRELPDEFHNKSVFETIELKFPLELIEKNSKDSIRIFLDSLSEIVKEHFNHRIFIFCELPVIGDFDHNLKNTVKEICEHNEAFNDAGFKLRTGGTDLSDFPSPDIIVSTMRQCLVHKVTLKFTAGMHHPIRHHDTNLKTMMHGFINVFGAGILAFRHAISDRELREMISDEDPTNFKFSDDAFEWREWKSDTEEIHGARNGLVLSFGSCSFDEPVEDLKKLRLI